MIRLVDKLTETTDKVSKMETSKMDTTRGEETFKKLTFVQRRLENNLEHAKNEMNSLENWVEKYLPLRLQH